MSAEVLKVRHRDMGLALCLPKTEGVMRVIHAVADDAADAWEPPARSAADVPSEAGAAMRFARLHGGQVRFDHRSDRWLLWDGQRYTPDADDGVTRLALEFTRDWQKDAVHLPYRDEREAALKFALRLEGRDALRNMLALAKAIKPIADAGAGWDADPWLLGVPNGVVDLRTGTLRPGRPEDRITMQTGAPFEPDATGPRWNQFIREVFAGHQPLMDFVHRALGYSLTGITSEQVLFLLYGTGANGKGTLTNTIKKVLGDYAWNMPFTTIEMKDRTAIPNDLAALVGRRFVIASETNDGTRLNEARVKALTGCDPVTARFLHGEFFTFEPFGKYWLSVNHKPIVRDDSHGFWRRLRLIPFTQRFEVNPTLADELAAEASAILSWCVSGCLAWQQHGLHTPSIVTDATTAYERDSDPLAAFLAEACDLAPAAEVGARDIFNHYESWAIAHGLRPAERLTSTAFGRKMAERFERVDGARRTYRGVARRQSV
jgi:putative DNA primase/helicase